MTLYNTKIREKKMVNKRAKFYGKKIVYFLISEYTARLKVSEGFNLKINITGNLQAILIS